MNIVRLERTVLDRPPVARPNRDLIGFAFPSAAGRMTVVTDVSALGLRAWCEHSDGTAEWEDVSYVRSIKDGAILIHPVLRRAPGNTAA